MTLSYDVFVSDPPQNNGVLPNGEPKMFSPVASTLIYGSENAVLTDPAFTVDQARVLGDWVEAKGRKLTHIFITHGHGDHWFAAGVLAERFPARVVATAGTNAQMHGNVAARPFLCDKVFRGIPHSPVTAVTVAENRFKLEGHDLVMVEVGHSDSPDTSVLHIPHIGLVVAGDVIYIGAHMYLGARDTMTGFGPWREAIDRVEDAETRQYLDDADELLQSEETAVDFLQRSSTRRGRVAVMRSNLSGLIKKELRKDGFNDCSRTRTT